MQSTIKRCDHCGSLKCKSRVITIATEGESDFTINTDSCEKTKDLIVGLLFRFKTKCEAKGD